MNKTVTLAVAVLLVVSGCQATKYIAFEREDTETTSDHSGHDSTSDGSDSAIPGTETEFNTDTGTNSANSTDTVDSGGTDSSTATLDSDSLNDDTLSDTDTASGSDDDTSTGSDSASDSDSAVIDGIPVSFSWKSIPVQISPAEGYVSIKDPTAVFYDDYWHVYATTRYENGDWGMTYLKFKDWADAGTAVQTPVNENPNITGYKVSPQLFYFSRDNRWYLIYQTQNPAYSWSTDPTDVSSWSPTKQFMPMPDIIENSTTKGIDYWVICDDAECFLFFTALNGVLYRARTPKATFPDGFAGTTEIVLTGDKYDIVQGCSVYAVPVGDHTEYLLLVMAITDDGNRYFRALTAASLDGEWTVHAGTEAHPFISFLNVTGEDWTLDGFYQGEILRANQDETMTIDISDLRFLYQGLVSKGEDASKDVFSLGLLEAN